MTTCVLLYQWSPPNFTKKVDVADQHHFLKHLTRVCILADLILKLTWSAENVGNIIKTYENYENKPLDMFMDIISDDAPHQKVMGDYDFFTFHNFP